VDRILPYFSFGGRANRQRYWLTSLAIYGLFIVLGAVAMMIPVVRWPLAAVVFAVFVVAELAVAVRRLHDRGKSGWWLIPMYVPLVLLSGLGALIQAAEGPNPAFSVFTLPFSIWIFVDLGCLKGTAGSNRFGPDPLGPSTPVEVFG